MPSRSTRSQKPHDLSQRHRFVETARALGCDEDEAAFKAKLAVIAKQKPKDAPVSSGDPSSGKEHE